MNCRYAYFVDDSLKLKLCINRHGEVEQADKRKDTKDKEYDTSCISDLFFLPYPIFGGIYFKPK